MIFDNKGIEKALLIDLYKSILLPRMIEEKMLILLRQGKISKWFSGIGQEAISVGLTKALDQDSYILPLHRNLGVFTSRDVSLDRLFSQFQGKLNGFTKGRDRSFHFGSKEHLSKYDFLKLTKNYFVDSKSEIKKVSSELPKDGILRPKNTTLDCNLFKTIFNYEFSIIDGLNKIIWDN